MYARVCWFGRVHFVSKAEPACTSVLTVACTMEPTKSRVLKEDGEMHERCKACHTTKRVESVAAHLKDESRTVDVNHGSFG